MTEILPWFLAIAFVGAWIVIALHLIRKGLALDAEDRT
jgi:hypothetical protein